MGSIECTICQLVFYLGATMKANKPFMLLKGQVEACHLARGKSKKAEMNFWFQMPDENGIWEIFSFWISVI